jgi:hypothetical protein
VARSYANLLCKLRARNSERYLARVTDIAAAALGLLPEGSPPNDRSDRQALAKTGRQIRYSVTLMPWMLAYAEWLILECIEPPKASLRSARARALARAPVSSNQIKLLEARDDFVAYCAELSRGPLERARAKFLAAFPDYVSAHRAALDDAVAAGDYKAVAAISEPVLDRVMPKKTEAVAATQINITLSPEQIAGVTAYEAPVLVISEPPPAPPEP